MPGKKACGKLKGQAKKDCLAYKGKYAKKGKSGKSTKGMYKWAEAKPIYTEFDDIMD